MVAVQSISIPGDDLYIRGDVLTFVVNFDGDIDVPMGSLPKLQLRIGGSPKFADYRGRDGATGLKFEYRVPPDDFDDDGIEVIALTGTVTDTVDGSPVDLSITAALPSTSGIFIDAVIPTVQSIVRAGASSTTSAGSVDYTVTFNRDVVNVSADDFQLSSTGTVNGVISVTGSGADYTVTVGNLTGDGTVKLNLKSATNIVDAVAGNAVLMPFTSGDVYTVDHTAPAVSSVDVPTAKTYGVGEELEFTVKFNDTVIVSGEPQLALTIGTSTVQAAYSSGSSSNSLTFKYTISGGQLDTDGVMPGALSLNGGAITDTAGNDATLTLNSIGSTTAVLVDAHVPLEVQSIEGPGADTYAAGELLEFKVTFDGMVEVTGAPRIALTIGGATRYAAYASGDGSDTLIFTYEVQDGDVDSNGIAAAATIDLNGGAIKDGASRNAALALPTVASIGSVLVDGAAPAVSSIVRVGSAAATNASTVQYTLTFDENVTGVDASDFVLTTDDDATGDISVTGSGASYTVTVSNLIGDGSLRLDLKASGTAIKDAHGNIIATGFTGGQAYALDHTPPAAPVFDPVATDGTISANEVGRLTISGTTDAQTTVSLTIGGQVRAATVTGAHWSYSVTSDDLTNMGAGPETLKVIAKDAAGNASLAGTINISVDGGAVPAQVVEESPPPERSADELFKEKLDARLQARIKAFTNVDKIKDHLGIDEDEEDPENYNWNLDHAVSAYIDGEMTEAQFERAVTKAVLPTVGVAHDVYTFFTGSPPTEAGLDYLIDSPLNPNDLTDPYYTGFTIENRFINFAVNLGKEGEGRAKFEADYGALSFEEAIAKAYGQIIGVDKAERAGYDVKAALKYIESQKTYFESLGGDPIGAKAAMIGYVISVGHTFEVGVGHEKLVDEMADRFWGKASSVADWDLI